MVVGRSRYERPMVWHGSRYLINAAVRSSLFPTRLRIRVLRFIGVAAGKGEIRGRVTIAGPNLTMGSGVFVNTGTSLLNQGGIVLEDNVAIAPEALLITTGHEIGPIHRRQGKLIRKPIFVGEGTWIGAKAVVLPGVSIGSGCVIGAGALVTRDCEANGLYVGVPAVRVRQLPDRDPAARHARLGAVAAKQRDVDSAAHSGWSMEADGQNR